MSKVDNIHPGFNKQNLANYIIGKLESIESALKIIEQYGGIPGNHHKAWVIDQVVRCLVDNYNEWVKYMCGEDGEYKWDKGIAP